MSNPRIYVACLSAYNNGFLHGLWVDLIQDLDDIHQEVRQMLQSSPMPDAEEWSIHDYENFDGFEISAYTSIERAHEIAEFLNKNGTIAGKLLQHFCGDVEDAQNALDNNAGEYHSLADFAESITEDTTSIPENLRYYIDYERMGQDMEMNGDIFTIKTDFEVVHVFWNS